MITCQEDSREAFQVSYIGQSYFDNVEPLSSHSISSLLIKATNNSSVKNHGSEAIAGSVFENKIGKLDLKCKITF